MTHPSPSGAFDKEHAEAYDARWKPLSALNGALHLLSRAALEDLPPDARILCAGVGTGAEILYLGGIFPGWRFVGFDPSDAMLDVCRARVEAAGLAGRFDLHHGFIDTLPESAPFDAATSFLVSHFLTDAAERGGFFRALAARLRPGGVLLNADLAPDKDDPSYPRLMKTWLATMAIAGMDEAGRERYEEMFSKAVAAQTPDEVEALIAANGFDAPVRFYQAAMIYAWVCRKS
jgi:tRNA (cmo5U34)-methyltransferase